MNNPYFLFLFFGGFKIDTYHTAIFLRKKLSRTYTEYYKYKDKKIKDKIIIEYIEYLEYEIKSIKHDLKVLGVR